MNKSLRIWRREKWCKELQVNVYTKRKVQTLDNQHCFSLFRIIPATKLRNIKKASMPTVGRVMVLLCADILAIYAMYVMMTYLTDVWGISFTHAAAIINVFFGLVTVSPLFLVFITDTILGNYWMLLISNIAYSVGLGLLTMSTPPVLANSTGNCSEYKPECISHIQRVLYYTAMPLIALGMGGHLTCLNFFVGDQWHGDQDNLDRGTYCRLASGITAVIVVAFFSVLGLPYIKPWVLRFGIPAIFTLIVTLLFISGSCSYKYYSQPGSPMMMFFRVFVAAVCKLCYRIPRDANELYKNQRSEFYKGPHTRSLRCLDKAAIIIPTKSQEEQEKNVWRLCTVTEVEDTKTIIRMIPVWMTFILCGVVSAIGFSFFIKQLDHLNHKVGRLNVPTVALLWFYEQSESLFAKLYARLANYLSKTGSQKFPPWLGIAISMILAILCCITAAKVENRRLSVVQKHGLVDKPDEMVPMSMFWLLPQFILLGAFSGIFKYSANNFFVDQTPVSTQRYLPFFISAVLGFGILMSVLTVYVVGKVSEKGGKANWFQHEINGSRLDKYYWTLAWLMAVNLVVFVAVVAFYQHKESELRDHDGAVFGGIDEGFDDNSKFCCCCC